MRSFNVVYTCNQSDSKSVPFEEHEVQPLLV